MGNPALARNVADTFAAHGIPCAIPARYDLGTWNIGEQTQSGYAMAKFGASSFDGNAGLRIVNSGESAD